MKVADIVKNHKLWVAPVRIQQPNYVGTIDVSVSAPNIVQARQLIKALYHIPDHHIGSIRELKS